MHRAVSLPSRPQAVARSSLSSLTGQLVSERVLVLLSLLILLLTTASPPSMRFVTVLLWLVSLGVLLILSPGGAVGVYIGSVALYNATAAAGLTPDRPDNLATPVILVGLLLLRVRRSRSALVDLSLAVVGTFLLYTFIETWLFGLMTSSRFRFFLRVFGMPLLLFLLLLKSKLDRRELNALIFALVAAGVYFAVVSVLERFGLYGVMLPPWLDDPQLSGVVGSSRSGGVFLMWAFNGLALNLTLALLLGPGGGWDRRHLPWVIGFSAIMLLGIYFTFSRGAWLAAIVGVPVLVMTRSGLKAGGRLRKVLVALAAFAFLAFVVFYPTRTASRVSNTTTIVYRMNVWYAGLRMIEERPIFGRGFGEFQSHVADYQAETSMFPARNLGYMNTSHNTTLNVAVEHGLAGLFLYLLVLAEVYRRARRGAIAMWGRQGGWLVLVLTWVYVLQVQFITANEPATGLLFFGTMGAVAGAEAAGSWARVL